MRKKLYLNTIISITYQITIIIIGLVIPRITLTTYGSEINGLISSITQMLGFISFLELGIGVIVQTSLYKPLVDNDQNKISLIYCAAQKYFRRVAQILILYIIVLCFYYGVFHSETYGWLFTTTLILTISINSFGQYYFSLCNILLLNADQKIYIATAVNLIAITINAIITIVMMKLRFSIQLVKLATSVIFLSKPFFLSLYVKSHYSLTDFKIIPKGVLKDKWSGIAQHISAVLTGSIDYIVLTVLSKFQLVSVYSVYVMPLNSIRNLILIISIGYKSFLGNIIARENKEDLLAEFNRYELISHFIITIIFGCASVVIVPFISVYTKDINDTNYFNYTFAILITLAYAVFSLQIPYTSIIFSAGHFKQTQSFCVLECVINLIISISLVKVIGISGVAIGTIVAVLYRIIASVLYLRKNILFRGLRRFSILFFLDTLGITIVNILSIYFRYGGSGYLSWVVYSSIVLIFSTLITCIIFKIVLFREFNIKQTLLKAFKKIKKR